MNHAVKQTQPARHTRFREMRRTLVLLAAFSTLAGCGALEEAEETPERAARSAEARRQAALPIAQAACGELERRAEEIEAEIEWELAFQRADEEEQERGREQRRAWGQRFPMLPPHLLPGGEAPPPRVPNSMAREHATLLAITAEMARRCSL